MTTTQTTLCACCAQPCSQGYYIQGEYYCCDDCLHADGYTREDYDADFREGCACWTTVEDLEPISTPDGAPDLFTGDECPGESDPIYADPTLPRDVALGVLFFFVALALTSAFPIH
jgi:hypothetical protein